MKHMLKILIIILTLSSCNDSNSDNIGYQTDILPPPSMDSTLLVGDYLFVSRSDIIQTQTLLPADSVIQHVESRIIYVAYGYYCGECALECTKMYKHYLIGNTTSFWTDKTDSYFADEGLKFETEMARGSQKISFELINNIPQSILKSNNPRNVYGCPDCDDGCGLYFDFQLDEPDSKPITYEMEYNLNGATRDIKDFGELIKKTLEKLEKYR